MSLCMLCECYSATMATKNYALRLCIMIMHKLEQHSDIYILHNLQVCKLSEELYCL